MAAVHATPAAKPTAVGKRKDEDRTRGALAVVFGMSPPTSCRRGTWFFSQPSSNNFAIILSSNNANSPILHDEHTSTIHRIRLLPNSPPTPGARSLSFSLSSPTFSIASPAWSGMQFSISFRMMLASFGDRPLVEIMIWRGPSRTCAPK
ncbi:hypothetical protein GSI_13505 [Ganoderma sinense ZZ0214-1]|uniref:Uncharacterized protein n=1 Tax=Ganoderma sinense ZZ0214-1 TaxID=1077348 RepID=A0A2G8RQG4_9APHY|nr:hypothetical protein GSI_13505 [Ganoderma sinense ZZ0214-1]